METQNAPPHGGAHCNPRSGSTKQPFEANRRFGKKIPPTPSSESGVPRRRIDKHILSSISNSASVLVPVNWRDSCHAYITTHSRYHGHRRRHHYGTSHNAAQPPWDPYPFIIFILPGPNFLEALSDSWIIGLIMERTTAEVRSFDIQRNTQVVSDNDRIPVLHTNTQPALG